MSNQASYVVRYSFAWLSLTRPGFVCSTLASTSSRNSARTAATRREHSGARSDSQASGDDSDALFEELEAGLDEDPDLGGFREKRMQELQQQCVRPLAGSMVAFRLI